MKKGRKRISEQERLIRHLEPLKNLCLDDIVNRLRSTYPSFYQRIKLPIFTTKVEKTLASLSVKQHSMAKQPRIRSIEQEKEEEIGQGIFHKRRRLNYAASESEEDSGEEDSGEDDSGKEDPGLAVCCLEYAIPNIPNNKLSPRVVQLNSGIGGDVRFSDLGGMEKAQNELERFVMLPFRHPELAISLGVKPVSGVLLHGPPGCGKTKLAHAIANELGIPFYKISATQLVSSVTGSSEENIRDLFSKAYRTAPSIVFIDEIDAIATKREDVQRAMEARIVTQLMTSMDESHRPTVLPAAHDDPNSNSQSWDQKYPHVLVIGATNRPDVIDSALRRPGRFELEIFLGPPDESARLQILSLLTRNLALQSGSFDLLKIARSTSGFVGADLTSLVNRAGSIALERIVNNMVAADVSIHSASPKCNQDSGPQVLTMADFEDAVKAVQPSLKREGFAAIPNVKWEDVGGLDSLREELYRSIVRRIRHPDIYKNFGLDLETGFLLYGPPGCGKTLIAKAVASEAGANFIYVKGAELLNKYVGESELAVRTLFSRARTCSPCIIFFDEVDALTTKRGRQGGWVVERLLNQLLAELDGGDQQQGVFVIGATNRPDAMDPAVLRPGRFGKHIYVSLPSRDERCLILKALARKKPIDPSVDLNEIGRWKALENFSGADLSAMMNEAAMAALEEGSTSTDVSVGSYTQTIQKCHLEQSVAKITPSVTNKQLERYLKFGKRREQCSDNPSGRQPRPHLGWSGLKECSNNFLSSNSGAT